MKKVSKKIIAWNILLWIGLWICDSDSFLMKELDKPLVVQIPAFILFCVTYFIYPWLYPPQLHKRMERFAEEKNMRGIGFRSDFFFPESYLIDMKNGYLIGLMLLSPFHFQYMDLKDLQDAEIITKIFNGSVVASVRIRLHMGDRKKYDIWMYRDARYKPSLVVDSEKEMTTTESTEKIKEYILEASKTAKQLRQ